MGSAVRHAHVLPRLRSIRGIVFDMDGTLTVPAIDFARMRSLVGILPHQPILETVMTFEEPKRSKALEVIKLVEKEGRENLQLLPGTRELLHYLGQHTIPCALLTRNDHEAVDHFLDILNLPKPVLQVIVTREFTPCKPDPAPLHHISAHSAFRIPTHQMLMVGDHLDDILCGQRAGAITCMIEQHTNVNMRMGADFCVRDPFELLHVLSEAWNSPTS